MDFISIEEFKKQPEKVQKVLKEYMEDKYVKGDLVTTHHRKVEIAIILESFLDGNKRKGYYCITQDKKTPMWVAEYPDWLIPLFKEGQLRKFIEDKTYTKVQIYYDGDYGYSVDIGYKDSFKEEHWGTYEKLGHDLLQAYWQVTCKIAEE